MFVNCDETEQSGLTAEASLTAEQLFIYPFPMAILASFVGGFKREKYDLVMYG
jgi:hypothetical protein